MESLRRKNRRFDAPDDGYAPEFEERFARELSFCVGVVRMVIAKPHVKQHGGEVQPDLERADVADLG
ncbi:hypothetical protein [Paraburkholderia tropica]|uniref:hypothetical protein n=1 Tax=Paraburkholderia tropica TaxID=92647 RepID=UPI0032B43EF5